MNSRTPRSRSSRSRDSISRVERKEATRRAIVGAALGLLDGQSFGSLSLREVTRAAGFPEPVIELYRSVRFGHVGGLQMVFRLRKPG